MSPDKKKILTKPLVVCLLAMICCLLWGSAFPCIKIGYRLFAIAGTDRPTQILFAGCRFVLAGTLTLLIGSLIARRPLLPPEKSFGDIMTLSLFQTILQYLFFYMGLAGTSGVKASIITATNVFWAILVATLIFHQEKLTVRKIIGCLLGFSGVVMVNLAGARLTGGFTLTGDGFILFSAIAAAVSSSLIKGYSQKYDPVTLSGWQFVAGGLVMILAGLVLGGRLALPSPAALGMLLYLGFLSATAYTLWSVLLKYNPVSTVLVYGFMNPIAGVLLSALLLGETSQAFSLAGLGALVLVCAGITVVNREQSQ